MKHLELMKCLELMKRLESMNRLELMNCLESCPHHSLDRVAVNRREYQNRDPQLWHRMKW